MLHYTLGVQVTMQTRPLLRHVLLAYMSYNLISNLS